MKKIITFLITIGLFMLSQLPIGTAVKMKQNGVSNTLILAICLPLFVLSIAIIVWTAYHHKILTKPFNKWFNGFHCFISFAGVLVLIILALIGSLLLAADGIDTTQNQKIIIELMANLPKSIIILGIVVMAPLAEEVIFRGFLLRLCPQKYQFVGYILGTLLFAVSHMPTNLASWMIYSGMGATLATIRYTTKHVEYSIITHALNNMLAAIPILMMA